MKHPTNSRSIRISSNKAATWICDSIHKGLARPIVTRIFNTWTNETLQEHPPIQILTSVISCLISEISIIIVKRPLWPGTLSLDSQANAQSRDKAQKIKKLFQTIDKSTLRSLSMISFMIYTNLSFTTMIYRGNQVRVKIALHQIKRIGSCPGFGYRSWKKYHFKITNYIQQLLEARISKQVRVTNIRATALTKLTDSGATKEGSKQFISCGQPVENKQTAGLSQ
ncbi:MAG: hypothetical protein EZS28_006670 [Streblomastix strix]|uniref:Uncharacterized protein n=1 Tax=Streblomastix strix TaxID=222440 RepID=A0A5J4WSA6_9EUKA|nr:MAG: hypothetical protein EZS28_006670 [Streblomastix strix]